MLLRKGFNTLDKLKVLLMILLSILGIFVSIILVYVLWYLVTAISKEFGIITAVSLAILSVVVVIFSMRKLIEAVKANSQ